MIFGAVVVTLLILLATKELAMINDTKSSVHLSKSLNVPIIIMVALFVLLLALGMTEILR